MYPARARRLPSTRRRKRPARRCPASCSKLVRTQAFGLQVWLSCLFYSGPRGCLLRTLSVEADCLMQRRASRSRTHGGARPIPDTPTLLQKPALILAVIGLPVGFRLGQSSPPLLAHPAACAWVGQGLAWSPPTLCSGLEGLAAASVVQHDFSSHTEGSCKACAGLCWPVFVEGTNESCEQWAVVPFRVASPTQAARLVGAGSGDWGVGEHRACSGMTSRALCPMHISTHAPPKGMFHKFHLFTA